MEHQEKLGENLVIACGKKAIKILELTRQVNKICLPLTF